MGFESGVSAIACSGASLTLFSTLELSLSFGLTLLFSFSVGIWAFVVGISTIEYPPFLK
jgi:hypothetical protein